MLFCQIDNSSCTKVMGFLSLFFSLPSFSNFLHTYIYFPNLTNYFINYNQSKDCQVELQNRRESFLIILKRKKNNKIILIEKITLIAFRKQEKEVEKEFKKMLAPGKALTPYRESKSSSSKSDGL